MKLKDILIEMRERDISKVVEAIYKYEAIRYGNEHGLGYDAAVNEVLKQMGFEK